MINSTLYIFYLINSQESLSISQDSLDDSMLLLNIIILIFVTLGIILLAFITTKTLARKLNYQNINRNMRVIEKLNLGLDKYLLLIEVGTNYYLLSATKNNIVKIDKIENIDIKQVPDQKQFKDIFSKIKI